MSPPTFFTDLRVVLAKDLRLDWRERGRMVAVLVFGVTTLLLFSFAGHDTNKLKAQAAGYLWLAILLCSTLSLSGSFAAEMQNRALEGLRLLPLDTRALYFGKALANLGVLLVLGTALIPVMVVLYDVQVKLGIPMLLGVILLGAAGLSGPGTLHAALAARVRGGDVLLPLLLFPLVVPNLLAATRATTLVIGGDPMNELRSWLGLLLCFNLVYWPLCGLLYGRVLED